MSWGGRRPGAGRPRKADTYAAPIAALEQRIADRLPQLLDNLFVLADGRFEQVTETWEPAGLLTVVKTIETTDGAVRATELAYPELPPEQLVCVRRVVSVAAPDRKANEYLIDRIAGRPTQQIDAAVDTPADGQLARFLESVTKIYGTDA